MRKIFFMFVVLLLLSSVAFAVEQPNEVTLKGDKEFVLNDTQDIIHHPVRFDAGETILPTWRYDSGGYKGILSLDFVDVYSSYAIAYYSGTVYGPDGPQPWSLEALH